MIVSSANSRWLNFKFNIAIHSTTSSKGINIKEQSPPFSHWFILIALEYTYDGREPSRNEEYGLTSNILKEKYEQLRSSYSRSISPESDYVDEDEKTKSEDEAEMDNIDDIEEEEEEIEEEEDQSQDEEIDDENLEGDIEEEEEDYDEEYEEEDDDELMKKLEAKYGKLDPKGTFSHSCLLLEWFVLNLFLVVIYQ